MCEKAKTKYFPDLKCDNHKRCEFLPVEWRSQLKLDGGETTSVNEGPSAACSFIVNLVSSLCFFFRASKGVVETVTPSKMAKLRGYVNDTALDVLYYTSPLYRSEVRIVFAPVLWLIVNSSL